MLVFPRKTTMIVLVSRFFICVLVFYGNYKLFKSREPCGQSVQAQLKFQKQIYAIRYYVTHAYIVTQIFIVTFCDKFFITFTLSSIYFMLELISISEFTDEKSSLTIIQAPAWWVLMFISTYSTRRVLTQFFVTQTDAEKTRDVLTAILDNLPDAVLISDEGKLSYCNQQADSFFGVSLSQLNALGDGGETFQLSQYQIMNNRCFHELKTSGVDQVAEKMMMTDDGSVSIMMTELGQSILTLTEVLQTFNI